MAEKRIAIVQSNYLPWKGFFDLIASVDEVVLFDDFQYTRRSWRNRNRIKTPQGLKWLTVPVVASPQRGTKISDVRIASPEWVDVHLKTLKMAYSRAPHFSEVFSMIQEELHRQRSGMLSDLNVSLISRICSYLGISTPIKTHRDYKAIEHRQLRLRDICLQAGASVYVSGPSANSYLDESVLARAGIGVEWFDYSGYSQYPQPWGEFTHKVSVVDLLVSQGAHSASYLKFKPAMRLNLDRGPSPAPIHAQRAA